MQYLIQKYSSADDMNEFFVHLERCKLDAGLITIVLVNDILKYREGGKQWL